MTPSDLPTVPWWRTVLHDEEAEAARRAVSEGCLSIGPYTAQLEGTLGELLDVPHVTTTTSGSVALLVALKSCGVGPGDEVIVANRTFIATAHAVQLSGASVCLVDTIARLPLMDPEEVEKAITPRTKAIICIHLNGRACHVRALRDLADGHDLYLIEDAAQALFSRADGRYLGAIGHVGHDLRPGRGSGHE